MGNCGFRRRRSIACLCLTALCLIMGRICYSEEGTDASAAPLRLGAIYNLTGDQAPIDSPSARGAQLAAAEINKQGGIRGRPLELIVRDGESNPQTVAAEARALVADEQLIALMGLSDTDMVLAAAPVAAQAGRVFLTSGATSPSLVAQVPDYLFLACFTDNVQAAAAAEFAARQLAISSTYILMDAGMDYTRLLGRYFGEAFEAFNGKIVKKDSFAHGASNLSDPVQALSQLDSPPGLLYLATGPEEASRVVTAYRTAGFGQPVFGGDSFDSPSLYSSGLAGPIYFTTHAYLGPEPSRERVRAFFTTYQQEYGEEPTAFSALGYDTVHLLAHALARAAHLNAESVRTALASTQGYEGITGTISYENGSREPTKSVTIIQVESSQRSLAAELIPTQVPSP